MFYFTGLYIRQWCWFLCSRSARAPQFCSPDLVRRWDVSVILFSDWSILTNVFLVHAHRRAVSHLNFDDLKLQGVIYLLDG